MIHNNINITNPELKNIFYSKCKTTLKLSYSNISIIRSNILNNYKNLVLTTLISKLEISVANYIIDIKYEYKKNNKKELRNQRIIIFGLDEKLKLLDYKKSNQFFLDNIFKIILSHLALINNLLFLVY